MSRVRALVVVADNYLTFERDGYLTSAESRFAVVKGWNGKGWWIVHRASGLGLESLLPRNSAYNYTLATLLGLIRTIEKSDLPLALLDDVDFGRGFRTPSKDTPKLFDDLRDIARRVLPPITRGPGE